MESAEKRMAEIRTFCPECGPHIGVDEDGLCVSCGCTAVGPQVDAMLARVERLEDWIAKLESGSIEAVQKVAVEAASLRATLADVVKWMDSDVVKRTLSQSAWLQLSHPHLGVPVTEEFSTWGEGVWKRARATLASQPPEDEG